MNDGTASRQVGYDGLLGAHLLLDGEEGLKSALAARPVMTEPNGMRVWFAQNLLRALQLHMDSESVRPATHVIDAVHSLLDDPYTAGPAIGFLVVHKHWDSLDRVLAWRAQRAAERPSIDRATRRCLIDCGSPRAKQALLAIEREAAANGAADGTSGGR